jgi:hypothetical protein
VPPEMVIPGASRSSVLLTRLYVPSGDVAEPAYAAKTSHWAAVMTTRRPPSCGTFPGPVRRR